MVDGAGIGVKSLVRMTRVDGETPHEDVSEKHFGCWVVVPMGNP